MAGGKYKDTFLKELEEKCKTDEPKWSSLQDDGNESTSMRTFVEDALEVAQSVFNYDQDKKDYRQNREEQRRLLKERWKARTSLGELDESDHNIVVHDDVRHDLSVPIVVHDDGSRFPESVTIVDNDEGKIISEGRESSVHNVINDDV